MRTRGSRSDSSSSSVDWGASALLDRTEAWSGRGARFRDRASLSAPRSHSALAGECGLSNVTPRADGPRPWDMTELSQNSKNFASFGFRKNHDGLQSFADTFSSRHLMRHGSKLPPKSAAADWRMDNGQRRGGGKRRFRFLRKKLSVSALKWATGGA